MDSQMGSRLNVNNSFAIQLSRILEKSLAPIFVYAQNANNIQVRDSQHFHPQNSLVSQYKTVPNGSTYPHRKWK